MTAFQRALLRYIKTGKATPSEMAEIVDVTAQHIRAVARGDRCLTHPKVETLSSWLVDERGLTQHVEGMLGVSGATHFHPEEIDHHDCLKDEIYEARNALGDADRALKQGDRDEARKKAKKARKEVDEAIAEIES